MIRKPDELGKETDVSGMLRKIGFCKFKKERELYAGSEKEDTV